MAQKQRIRRGAAVWQQLFRRQSSGGLSVPEFCRREGDNASLFRRWRSTLKDSEGDRRVISKTVTASARLSLLQESRGYRKKGVI
jgi:transposase-like protein